MREWTIGHLRGEAATRRLGECLAATAEAGDLLILTGELGAGKTTLVRAIADGLGIPPEVVRSPSFTLVHTYQDGRLPMHHIDAYRLGSAEEFFIIGGEEHLDDPALTIIEWGERILDALPDDWLRLLIAYGEGDDERTVQVQAVGLGGTAWLQRLSDAWARSEQSNGGSER